MSQQTPTTDPPAHITSLRDLTVILIKHYRLHEGRYQLGIGFRIGVGTVPAPEASEPLPGAIMGVQDVRLKLIKGDIVSPDVVDAALVNPRLTKAPAKKAPAKKATARVPAKRAKAAAKA